MDNDAFAREEKLLAAKKKLKKYQKKKANNVSSVDKINADSVTTSSTRRSSMSSDAGSVKTDYADGKVSEIITNVEENISQNDTTSIITEVESNQNQLQDVNDRHHQTVYIQQRSSPLTNNLSSHGSIVEGLQPIDYHQSSEKESQTNTLTTPINSNTSTENSSDEQTITFERLANLYRMQQQTITLLVEEKTALESELEKYSAMANRFKSSEELLKEGQLLVDALRRQNDELEEKIRTIEDRLKDANTQNEKTVGSLQLQNTKVQQLENDNKQLSSQLNDKDSIIEQLKIEKNNLLSASNQVEKLQKIIKDKEEHDEKLEMELSDFKIRFNDLVQQLSEKQEKTLVVERNSDEKQSIIDSMNNQLQLLTNEKNELQQSLQLISSELESEKIEITDLTDQLKLKSAIVAKIESEKGNLSAELQQAKTDNHDLSSQLTELKKLKENVAEISKDKLLLTKEISNGRSRIAGLESEMKRLIEELDLTRKSHSEYGIINNQEIVHEKNRSVEEFKDNDKNH
ncbi:10715_t:CDS:2 [Entrophospora sp. SA101]|nr:10715_t:CDS:2 [Entrophospora sp. SA101]